MRNVGLLFAAAPVDTLCGAPCGPATFTPSNPVRVSFPGGAAATITHPNVAECPGQWVVHEISNFFYTQVTDPLQVRGGFTKRNAPAAALARAC